MYQQEDTIYTDHTHFILRPTNDGNANALKIFSILSFMPAGALTSNVFDAPKPAPGQTAL